MRRLSYTTEARTAAAAWVLPALMVAALFAVGCGGNDAPPDAAKGHKARHYSFSPGEGKLVDVGDGRSLRLLCVGSGHPTIVVSADTIERSAGFRDDLAQVTRTCAYDSAGSGYSSEPSRTPVDARGDSQDLEKLLHAARVPAPYVLVADSIRSPAVSLFAQAHGKQTAGLVLVEGVGANWRSRLLALGRGEPARVQRQLRRAVGPPVAGGIAWSALGTEAASVATLGRTPVGVVSTMIPPLDPRQRLPARVRRAAIRLNTTMEDELAALSSNHIHVVATQASDIPLEEQPRVIATMVQAIVRAAREQTPLPPCAQIFHGAGVRCRT